MEGPYPVENIDRLGVLMFQTSDNSQLLRGVLWINAELTIVSSLKHKNTQPIYIFNRENLQNSEPQNGPRRGLDFIALVKIHVDYWKLSHLTPVSSKLNQMNGIIHFILLPFNWIFYVRYISCQNKKKYRRELGFWRNKSKNSTFKAKSSLFDPFLTS
jgi:hypothetical protein